MSGRARLAGFGSVVALVLAGAVCAITVGGALADVLAFVLIAGGLVLATSLVFLEVGLTEDRELEREAAARDRDAVFRWAGGRAGRGSSGRGGGARGAGSSGSGSGSSGPGSSGSGSAFGSGERAGRRVGGFGRLGRERAHRRRLG